MAETAERVADAASDIADQGGARIGEGGEPVGAEGSGAKRGVEPAHALCLATAVAGGGFGPSVAGSQRP